MIALAFWLTGRVHVALVGWFVGWLVGLFVGLSVCLCVG